MLLDSSAACINHTKKAVLPPPSTPTPPANPNPFPSVHPKPLSDKNSTISHRPRKSSALDFSREVQQFEQRHSHVNHRLKTSEVLETLQQGENYAQQLQKKDVFLQSKLFDELETHYQGLERETEPLQKEEADELDYVTYRMVKQNQKTQLQRLRARMIFNPPSKQQPHH